jgi:hypothetical protein
MEAEAVLDRGCRLRLVQGSDELVCRLRGIVKEGAEGEQAATQGLTLVLDRDWPFDVVDDQEQEVVEVYRLPWFDNPIAAPLEV